MTPPLSGQTVSVSTGMKGLFSAQKHSNNYHNNNPSVIHADRTVTTRHTINKSPNSKIQNTSHFDSKLENSV